MKFLILSIVAIVCLSSCDKENSSRTIRTFYEDCEIVEDDTNRYRYFVRKPDGSVVTIWYDGVEQYTDESMKKREVPIFKPTK